MSVMELLCAVALIVPAFCKRPAILAPIAAVFVAAVCAFVIYGRLVLEPIRRGEFA